MLYIEVVFIDKELNEDIVKDMKIINEEIMPDFEKGFSKYNINAVSAIFYFTTVIKNILSQLDDDQKRDIKEVVIRYIMD